MTILTVGSGQKYTTIAAAVAAASSGDTVNVLAGTYTNDFLTIRTSLTIQAVGGPVAIVAAAQPPNGKAIITEGAPGITVTLSGLTLSGATVPDGNGAGVRYEGGKLVMTGMTVTGNQEGLLGGADSAGSISISNSTFSGNGAGDGYTHGIYVGAINSFTLTNSTVKDTAAGHEVKSRAANNVITGNVITDMAGTASYEIDLPNGGNTLIANNTIQKGTNANNPVAISYGEEGSLIPGSALTVANNLLINDFTAHLTTAVRNSTAVTASVTGNTFYGWNATTAGNATVSGNITGASDPLFDPAYYLAKNPSVALSGMDPYTHYMTVGWKQGLDPSALFSTNFYLSHNPDVKAAGVNPLLHYETYGGTEGRATDAFFDSKYYLTQNPDVKASGLNPLVHFLTQGWKQGLDPSLMFSTSKYLASYSDVTGTDPLLQFLTAGQGAGRASQMSGGTAAADPLVNPGYYDPQLGATLVPTGLAAAQQAAYSFHTSGWKAGLNPDAWFNTTYYLAHNPDVAAAHVDPLLQYETTGWKEGRDPSALFSTTKYLTANPDVKAAGINPLLHYVAFGQAEGRAIYPA